MELIFISNNPKDTMNGNVHIPINKDMDMESQLKEHIRPDNSTIYIINVHTRYKNSCTTQGGVDIYRYIMHRYNEDSYKHLRLNIIFYSPFSQEFLVKFQPENYVLNLLPFVCFSLDGKFQENINKKVAFCEAEENNQFCNASENLLAGWSKSASDKKNNIDFQGKEKILFIDDENQKWTPVLDLVIGTNSYEALFSGNQSSFRISLDANLNNNKLLFKTIDYHLIISDFYLLENHMPSIKLNVEELKNKSGYKLFKKLKETGSNRGIAYMFFTSSSKIEYYKFFDKKGIDDWAIKEIEYNLNLDLKKDYYERFYSSISQFYKEENYKIYQSLKYLSTQIDELKKHIKKNEGIFKSNLYVNLSNFDEVITNIDYSFDMLKIMVQVGILAENKNFNDYYSLIVNKLFHNIEYLQKKLISQRIIQHKVRSYSVEVLSKLRNYSSHNNERKSLTVYDTFFCFYLLIDILMNGVVILKDQVPNDVIITKQKFFMNYNTNIIKCYPLILYVYFKKHIIIDSNKPIESKISELIDINLKLWNKSNRIVNDELDRIIYENTEFVKHIVTNTNNNAQATTINLDIYNESIDSFKSNFFDFKDEPLSENNIEKYFKHLNTKLNEFNKKIVVKEDLNMAIEYINSNNKKLTRNLTYPKNSNIENVILELDKIAKECKEYIDAIKKNNEKNIPTL